MTDHVMGPVPTEDPMHRLVAGYRRQLAERTAERDRARAAAVGLEQQLAQVAAVLAQAHVPVALRVHAVEAMLSDVGDLVGIEGMPAGVSDPGDSGDPTYTAEENEDDERASDSHAGSTARVRGRNS